MAYFGRSRDVNMFSNINNELLGQVIEQKVGFYQVILDETAHNIYGESLHKKYIGPVLLTCLLERGDTTPVTNDFGMDFERKLVVRFFRPHLVTAGVDPSVGDIILWNEDYYEVNNVNENMNHSLTGTMNKQNSTTNYQTVQKENFLKDRYFKFFKTISVIFITFFNHLTLCALRKYSGTLWLNFIQF